MQACALEEAEFVRGTESSPFCHQLDLGVCHNKEWRARLSDFLVRKGSLSPCVAVGPLLALDEAEVGLVGMIYCKTHSRTHSY